MEWERIDLPKDSRLKNKMIERMLLPIGTEVVLNNVLIAKVVFNNVGRRRMSLEVTGLVKKVEKKGGLIMVDNIEINKGIQ